MDVKQRQLASTEQEVILDGLARAVARPDARFLEVGSWCGDSTLIFARVAQECGGLLFCVDWWKGNPQTELADIAAQEDIFSIFWERICLAGLQDVVIPLRGRSDVIAQVLRPETFQLIFLDADHRYENIVRDIQAYAPLVSRDGGILCGHDCEGRLTDFDPAFLEAGKIVDYHETVHCGVVLAVGAAFADYTINHSIWSVRAGSLPGNWEPTNLTFPGVAERRQTPPPPLAAATRHNLLRYGNQVYAVPRSLDEFDITDEVQRNTPGLAVVTARRVLEGYETKATPVVPLLLEEGYLGFNIVAFQGRYYSLAQDIGTIDLLSLPPANQARLTWQGKLFVENSLREAKLQVARARLQTAP